MNWLFGVIAVCAVVLILLFFAGANARKVPKLEEDNKLGVKESYNDKTE